MARNDEPKLTAWEKARVAGLVARMAKRGLADDRQYGGRVNQRDLEARIDRIVDGARRREEQQGKRP
ncbi:DUF6257 family protein [Streptomyces wuyuanensis]|uniref:DUF6257 family protein n=1 Tax=Streptomyces wuyuanensis TaxID=1196353 RepID=UPI0037A627C4